MSLTSIILVGCFLLFVLLPYIFYRRRSLSNPEEFAVGARNYGWFGITSGLSATFVGGAALLNLPSIGYTYRWYALADVIPTAAALFLSALVIAPVIRRVKAVSLGTYLRSSGTLVAGVSGILSLVVYTLISGAQILALTRLLSEHIPLATELIAIFCAGFVGAYILYNGYRAVTLTDRLQFIVMLVFFLGIIGIAVLFTGPANTQHAEVPAKQMPLDMILLLGTTLLFVPVSQDVHVRIHSAKSLSHAIGGCIGAGVAYLAFGITAVYMGVHAAKSGLANECFQVMVVFKDSRKCSGHECLAKTYNIPDKNATSLIQMVSCNLHSSFLEVEKLIAEITRNAKFGEPSPSFLGKVIGHLQVDMVRRYRFASSPAGFDDLNEFLRNIDAPSVVPAIFKPCGKFVTCVMIQNVDIQLTLLA